MQSSPPTYSILSYLESDKIRQYAAVPATHLHILGGRITLDAQLPKYTCLVIIGTKFAVWKRMQCYT